ncbi:MAG: hypothetical protein U5R06_19325 [candidate division KSB1 bacterium]|nr:hypothetical protein [candidate division KSB1 bacterium]
MMKILLFVLLHCAALAGGQSLHWQDDIELSTEESSGAVTTHGGYSLCA